MKKIITIILALLFTVNLSYAKSIKEPKIKFNGNKYYLLYSAQLPDYEGCLNEYYKNGETYNLWSEMVAVHHFPNAYSPIDRVKQFRTYLGSIGCPSAMTFNDKKNTATIDFLLINQIHGRTLMEFNVFKYEKSKQSGSNALQYARRYVATNALEVDQIKRDFEKNRKSLINKVKDYKIPTIITEPIDKCAVESEILGTKKEPIPDIPSEEIKPIENSDQDTNTVDNNSAEITNDASDSSDVKLESQHEDLKKPVIENIEQKQDITTDENFAKENVIESENIEIKSADNSENKSIENKEKTNNVDSAQNTVKIEENQKKSVKEDNKQNNINNKNKKNKNEKQKKDQKVKKTKKQKEMTYMVINDKSEYYPKSKKPRKVTKKDLKRRAKEAEAKLRDTL